MEPKEPTIFDTMKTLFTKTHYPSEHDIKKVPSYIMVNWLASVPKTTRVAYYIDSKGRELPIELQFKFAYYAAPKMTVPIYPKNIQTDNADLELLMYKYNINIALAKDYINMLPPEEMQKIRDEYKYFDIKQK